MCVLSLVLYIYILNLKVRALFYDFHLSPDMCNVLVLILSLWTQIAT